MIGTKKITEQLKETGAGIKDAFSGASSLIKLALVISAVALFCSATALGVVFLRVKAAAA